MIFGCVTCRVVAPTSIEEDASWTYNLSCIMLKEKYVKHSYGYEYQCTSILLSLPSKSVEMVHTLKDNQNTYGKIYMKYVKIWQFYFAAFITWTGISNKENNYGIVFWYWPDAQFKYSQWYLTPKLIENNNNFAKTIVSPVWIDLWNW